MSSKGTVWKSSSSSSFRYTWASRVVLEVDGRGSGLWGAIHGLVLGKELYLLRYLDQMKHSQHWTCGGSLMFFSVELVCWPFLNSTHNLHLLMPIFIQRLHLRWSRSDWIIFHQVADVVYVLMLCKRMLSRLLLWHCWGCVHQDQLSRTVMQLQLHSIPNIL